MKLSFILLTVMTAVVDGRNLRGQPFDLVDMVKDSFANLAHAAATGADIEGSNGGAPRAAFNTTASGEHLVEELLSHKKLTQEVRLQPKTFGLIRSGRIYDIYLKDAQVGDGTHVLTEDGEVSFVVKDLSVEVSCKYDLRLTTFDYGESGEVKARLHGKAMTLSFPTKGSGTGGCIFDKGLDLEIINATSSRDAFNVAILDLLRNNALELRTEIVQEMEDGLCRSLLEPRAMQPAAYRQPLVQGESMWPLVIGFIFLSIALLCGAFVIGRQTVHLGLCTCLQRCNCCFGQSSTYSAPGREQQRTLSAAEEGHTSSGESHSDISDNHDFLQLSNAMSGLFRK